MLIFLSVIALLAVATIIFINQPKFGKAPAGARLERLKKSGFYKDGKVQNINLTPALTEGVTYTQVFKRFFFGKTERKLPQQPFHFSKTDLKTLDPSENLYTWMGHSSYYLQLEGKKILVDPVLSGAASPLSFTTKAFAGADSYTVDDLPEIDYLVISHDHWDHLDYETIKKLQSKVKQVITGLGTGEHFEYWGYDPKIITELIWGESKDLGNGFKVYCETARHFSGRGLKRDQSMWASFVFETPTSRIYIGGDSGFDDHFAKIGNKYTGFDLAILETGQYDQDWKYIHMLPGEQLQAMKDLKAKVMIPVHNSKFALANHSWDDPLKKLTEANQSQNLRVITPKIGEKVNWADSTKVYEKWWEGLK